MLTSSFYRIGIDNFKSRGIIANVNLKFEGNRTLERSNTAIIKIE